MVYNNFYILLSVLFANIFASIFIRGIYWSVVFFFYALFLWFCIREICLAEDSWEEFSPIF